MQEIIKLNDIHVSVYFDATLNDGVFEDIKIYDAEVTHMLGAEVDEPIKVRLPNVASWYVSEGDKITEKIGNVEEYLKEEINDIINDDDYIRNYIYEFKNGRII